jgi:hypothetical protein
MDNVIDINKSFTKSHIDPDSVLEGAKGKLSKVIVMGYEGDYLYLASSSSSRQEILYLIEQFKFKLFNGDFD